MTVSCPPKMQDCEEPSSVLFVKLLTDIAQPFFSLTSISIFFHFYFIYLSLSVRKLLTHPFSDVDNKSQPSKLVSLFICPVDLTARSNSSPDLDP